MAYADELELEDETERDLWRPSLPRYSPQTRREVAKEEIRRCREALDRPRS
jgi:hypothetical protein